MDAQPAEVLGRNRLPANARVGPSSGREATFALAYTEAVGVADAPRMACR